MLHLGSAISAVTLPEAWPWAAMAVLGNHLVLGAAGMAPRSHLLGPNLVRLPERSARRAQVTLTFDDGPDPAVTPRLLDILGRYGATASFFCIGEKAVAHPGILRDIIARGHSIENHSYSHSRLFACYSLGAMRRDVEAGQNAIATITGRPPRFFRAPMGLRSPLLDPVLAAMRLRYVSWTRRGYDTASRDPRRVVRRLTAGLAAGDVLLLHDGGSARGADGKPVALAVLPMLLDEIAARGLVPVSLSKALEEEGTAPAADAAPRRRPAEVLTSVP